MKKILLLGIALTVASSAAMAQNWNYATQPRQGGYAQPRQRQYQRPVQRQQAARPAQRRAQPQQARAAQRATQPAQKTYQPAAKQVDNSYMAEDNYKLGNPLYVPHKGQSIIEPSLNFIYSPEDKDSGQIEGTGFQLLGGYTIGLTDKLSLNAKLGYTTMEHEDGDETEEDTEILATIGARYHALSIDGFDVNVGGNLKISKQETETKVKGYGKVDSADARLSSVDMYVLAGTTVQNVSPYVKFGFSSSLWSEYNTGTGYFFQPGVYVDINPMLGLDLNLDIQEDMHSMGYSARLDIYPAENISLGAGLEFAAPEEHFDYFMFKTSAKFAF